MGGVLREIKRIQSSRNHRDRASCLERAAAATTEAAAGEAAAAEAAATPSGRA